MGARSGGRKGSAVRRQLATAGSKPSAAPMRRVVWAVEQMIRLAWESVEQGRRPDPATGRRCMLTDPAAGNAISNPMHNAIARRVHDAFLAACSFGYMPPIRRGLLPAVGMRRRVLSRRSGASHAAMRRPLPLLPPLPRLSLLINCQHPHKVTGRCPEQWCTRPDCKGNRLELEPTPQFKFEHHKTSDM